MEQTDAISRSDLLRNLGKRIHAERKRLLKDALLDFSSAIINAPALDVAPVVHAHWIKTFGSDGFVSTLRCSKCGNAENSTYIPGNFCWFCGAKMDGEAE